MASNIQPYAQPPNHAARVDSADDLWGDIIGATTAVVGAVGVGIGYTVVAAQDALHGAEAAGDQLPADIELAGDVLQAGPAELGADAGAAAGGGDVGLGVEIGVEGVLSAGEFAAAAQTAQARLQLPNHVDSVPLDLQDGDVANADASIKAAQNKSISNPVQLAMQAGKKQNPSAQAPLTAFQNLLLLAPQQAEMAKAPNALPSAIQAGVATPVNPSAVPSRGRKMLQSAPDCCNTYTVKPGDTLASIAAAYGQPTNGAHVMQARRVCTARAANGLSGDVAPGQTIMLPCGRLLSYISAYNAGLITKAGAVNANAG
ncbi:hypothetical protein COCOBI_10-0990 [Coccomyxa sp. Obi]|nr:hypothetical protein COCOBI_10-0990 [Coccomyxa sp. Obi]